LWRKLSSPWPGLHDPGPAREVGDLLALLLREQVVGDPERQLAVGVELLDHGVVVGVVLEAAAGVDHARDTQPVHLAHEVPGRVELLLGRQLRALGEGRVEDHGVGLGEQQPGRVARPVALDEAARRVGVERS
jgi:hypothetical protein